MFEKPSDREAFIYLDGDMCQIIGIDTSFGTVHYVTDDGYEGFTDAQTVFEEAYRIPPLRA